MATCPKCSATVKKNGVHRDNGGGAKGKDGRQNYRCVACNWQGTNAVLSAAEAVLGIDKKATKAAHRELKAELRAKKVERVVVTAAQNATPVHDRFWASLKTYCDGLDARLVVVPYRYTNPTSQWSDRAKSQDWWAPEVVPHLLDQHTVLNDNLELLAHIKTQATAVRPLEGFESMSGKRSAIVAHPKLQLKTVATPEQRLPKVLTTTGACTRRNYIDSKAGRKGEFHHTFGAAVVEMDGDRFHLRQINAAKDGTFVDLRTRFTPDGVEDAPRCEALVMGDTHMEFIDPGVREATFGPGGIVATLRPRFLVWHDVHDFTVGSHHNRKKTFTRIAQSKAGRVDVEAELVATFTEMRRLGELPEVEDLQHVVVASNHHEHLLRWVEETDPRQDVANAEFWARLFVALAQSAEWREDGPHHVDPFAMVGQPILGDRFRFLSRGESFMLKGVELSYHGDKGANGSRGSIRQFNRIGAKTIIGHGHGPGIDEGAHQVGTSARLDRDYMRGQPSNHLHTHDALYGNGKRTLINIIDGKWRIE